MSIQEHYMLTRKTMRYLATQKCARDTQKRGLGRVITRRNTRRERGTGERREKSPNLAAGVCVVPTEKLVNIRGGERERSKRTRKHKQTKRENEKFFFTSG